MPCGLGVAALLGIQPLPPKVAGMMSYLDPAERLAGLRLDEEAAERCACRLYPGGIIVPDEGCPEHPDAITIFDYSDTPDMGHPEGALRDQGAQRAEALSLCGASTKSGGSCRNPVRPGGRCAAGHQGPTT